MRTAIIIAVGLALWGSCLGLTYLAAGLNARTAGTATVAFTAVWFVAAGVNLWMGVTRAAYSLRDELPIFLLIFALPVALAFFVKFKWFSAALD